MTRLELYNLHTKLCADALTLMRRKNADYATADDPFRNFRMFGALGFLVRMGDKLARLRTFVETGKLENESVYDSIIDLINYPVLLAGYIASEQPAAGTSLPDSTRTTHSPEPMQTGYASSAAPAILHSHVRLQESDSAGNPKCGSVLPSLTHVPVAEDAESCSVQVLGAKPPSKTVRASSTTTLRSGLGHHLEDAEKDVWASLVHLT
jgi:hypothetical protein